MSNPTSMIQIQSAAQNDEVLDVRIVDTDMPTLRDSDVLVRVEAAPINPSDLGLLFGPADMDNAQYSSDSGSPSIKAPIPSHLMSGIEGRIGQNLPVGNEGAGVIIDAGVNAKALIGKTVGLAGGAMYSQYRCVPAASCLVMDDGTSPAEAASSFVNPLTALAFVETMRMENHTAMVHTAAASNLGQMLVKICKDDEIPLVNIVRKQEQVDILKNIGAEYVCNTSDSDFMDNLVSALIATGATLGFDATGGGNNGKLPGQILAAMEIAANKTAKEYSRYGSDTYKQVYIYGGLDQSPTILKRAYGMSWGLGGWLLTPMIGKIGMEKFQEMRIRVAKEIKSTFSSSYAQEISFEEMLQPEIIKSYAKQATGKKYLVNPHK